jgi:integrase
MNNSRVRYQQGSLTIEARKNGPAVWVYRWREVRSGGDCTKRKVVVGSKLRFPTKAAAMKQVGSLGLEINSESPASGATKTVSELIDHYRQTELTDAGNKTARTVAVYEQQLRQYILHRWGGFYIGQVKTVAVEAWLRTLFGAPATKAKTRGVMSSLFQHARRHEWAATNPISLVRQSAIRVKEPEVLTPDEVCGLLGELLEPSKTIVYLAATTGMRRGELFGLKWSDVDLERGQLKVVRSIVDQTVGETKTRGSMRPLPLPDDVVAALRSWRSATNYQKDEDWIFASPQSIGKLPYWPNAVMVRHVQPAADRAGITKRIGWHTFRHTLATLLQASGAGIKVTQELLRHSSPVMTIGTYAQAVTGDKRDAQAIVAASFTRPPKQQTADAHEL